MSIFYESRKKGMSINTGNDVVYDQPHTYLVTSNVLLLIAVIVKRCQIAPKCNKPDVFSLKLISEAKLV